MTKIKLRKNFSTGKYLGCTNKELKEIIEKQFTPQMNWGNYGVFGWHIDHIIPLAAFDLTKEEHKQVALHHSNLRPLWWEKNISKADQVPSRHSMSPELYEKASMLGIVFYRPKFLRTTI